MGSRQTEHLSKISLRPQDIHESVSSWFSNLHFSHSRMTPVNIHVRPFSLWSHARREENKRE